MVQRCKCTMQTWSILDFVSNVEFVYSFFKSFGIVCFAMHAHIFNHPIICLLSAHAVQNHFQLYVFLSIFAIYSHLFLSHLYIFISIIFINNFNNLLSLLINFKVIDFSINSTSYMPPKMANNIQYFAILLTQNYITI